MSRVLRAARAVSALIVVGACASAPAATPVTLNVLELNGSGVSGTVTMTPIGDDRTLVEVRVEPAGHPSMPAHIHPGSCAELVPQPKYALDNVVDGASRTELAASLDELLSGGQALNLHKSNEEMQVYSACVDLS